MTFIIYLKGCVLRKFKIYFTICGSVKAHVSVYRTDVILMPDSSESKKVVFKSYFLTGWRYPCL